jgi:hypothetical protein
MSEIAAEKCLCASYFGQMIHAPACEMHTRCQAVMRGVPIIRCILTEGHSGEHK